VAEEVSSRGRGNREAAVGAVHHAAADVERGTVPGVNGEGVNSGTGSDDVDDRVDGADLMEMDLFDVSVVNLCLAGSEEFEGADGGVFYRIGQVCSLDKGADDRKRPAVGVRVIMLVGGSVLRVVVVVVMVRVSVLVLVIEAVVSVGMVVGVLGGVAAFQDTDLGRRDSAAIGLLDGERSVELQCGDGVMENFGGDASVDQGPKKHVAADAGQTVEIGDAHGRYCFTAESAMLAMLLIRLDKTPSRCRIRPFFRNHPGLLSALYS